MKTRAQAAAGGGGGDDEGRKMKGKETADVGAGKAKRSRVAGRPLCGSAMESIADAMALSRGVVKDCEEALTALAYIERQDQAVREADFCRCGHNRPGGSLEDALEIDDDDDDDVEVLAITSRPLLPRRNFVLNPSIAAIISLRRHQRRPIPAAGDTCASWRKGVERMMKPPPALNSLESFHRALGL